MRLVAGTIAGLVALLGCSPTMAQPAPGPAITPAETALESVRPATDATLAVQDPRQQQIFVPITDPSGEAMAPWHDALRRAANGQGQARVAWYGASHTAADIWSGQVRRDLQGRFGDAGHGFLLPFRWHGGYRHQDVNSHASKGWTVHRHRMLDPVPEGDYGYGGVAVSSADPQQWMEVRTCSENECGRKVDKIEVWVRRGPGGGTLLVTIDGKVHPLPTKSKTVSVHFERYTVNDGSHTLRLAPKGDGEVKVYGAVFERSAPGLIVDQLGIPGMRGGILLNWHERPWRLQVQQRRPNLVILAYGTNAVGDDHEPISRFRAGWRQVLERVRTAAPQAACLIVGTTDRPTKPDEDGRRFHRPRIDLVNEAQREVAAEYGCGFWDAFAAMGGRGSMLRWVEAGLAGADHVHLTRAGYELKAKRLIAALLEGYGDAASSRAK